MKKKLTHHYIVRNISSLYRFKSRIKKKYGHDLKMVNITEPFGYHYNIGCLRSYLFICKKCSCLIEIGTLNGKNASYQFKLNDRITIMNPIKCNEYMIKGILE